MVREFRDFLLRGNVIAGQPDYRRGSGLLLERVAGLGHDGKMASRERATLPVVAHERAEARVQIVHPGEEVEHAFVDGPVLNCFPLLVSALDREGRLIQALSKKVHRKRRAHTRSTRATSVLPLRVPKTRKPAVRC